MEKTDTKKYAYPMGLDGRVQNQRKVVLRVSSGLLPYPPQAPARLSLSLSRALSLSFSLSLSLSLGTKNMSSGTPHASTLHSHYCYYSHYYRHYYFHYYYYYYHYYYCYYSY